MTTTRALPSATKIRRGLGLLVLAAVGLGLLTVFTKSTHDSAFGFSTAATLLTLTASFAVTGCALVGLVLLLWGLLRD